MWDEIQGKWTQTILMPSNRQRHLVELVEPPYLRQIEPPRGTGGKCRTAISHTGRDTPWNWWNCHISHSQRGTVPWLTENLLVAPNGGCESLSSGSRVWYGGIRGMHGPSLRFQGVVWGGCGGCVGCVFLSTQAPGCDMGGMRVSFYLDSRL